MTFGEAVLLMLRGYSVSRSAWKEPRPELTLFNGHLASPAFLLVAPHKDAIEWAGFSHDFGATDWQVEGLDR